MQNACALPVDHLLLELRRHEPQLRAWMNSSEANAVLFVQDPPAALRAANLGISEDTILELEQVLREISERLDAAPETVARGSRTALI